MEILLNNEQRIIYDDVMQEVNYYLNLIDKELDKLGALPKMYKRIPIEKVFTSKAKSRHACVNRNEHTLNISEFMFNEDRKELVNTLLHEMCHMYQEAGHGHGSSWKLYANIASQVSGLEITRCRNVGNQAEEYRVRREELIKKSGLRFKCKHCGQLIERTRRSNFTEHYDRYTCGRCGGHFEKITG